MSHREPRLTDKIVQSIKALIQEQGLEAGMRLPAERMLASELACSRSILREAIQKLVGEGVLVSRGGGGTYLCYEKQPWSEQRLVQPLKTLLEEDPSYRLDIIEARHTIEASTAWYAALRATPEDKDKLIACFDATLKFKESDDPALAAQADVRFHLAIAEASHNLVLLQTMRGFFDLLQSSVRHSRQHMYTTPTIFAQLTEQHHELLQAILTADPERAKRAAQLHLSFVHSTHRTQQEDRARQSRLTRLPDDNNAVTREKKS